VAPIDSCLNGTHPLELEVDIEELCDLEDVFEIVEIENVAHKSLEMLLT